MRIWHSPACLRLILVLCFLLEARGQGSFTPLPPNTTTAADSVLTFNEIMYHAAGDDPALEWVELYNQMSINLDVSGWRIEGGVQFQFPANTAIAADSYVVIAANPARLKSAGLTNIYGPFTGRLANAGELIRLVNQSGRLLDELRYTDEEPWPVGADGSSASLSKRDRFAASSPAPNWRASAQPGGTPGRANFDDRPNTEPAELSLIRTDSPARWIVPSDDRLGSNWTAPGFDDASWSAGTAAIGYDTATATIGELTNVALNKRVITGSGAYANNPFDIADGAGNFIAQNVTDGSVSDVFGQNYWLGREGMLNEEFTLDLGQSFQIEEIHLRNTHNTQHNDRGTDEFEIWAAQSIDASKKLVNPIRVLKGRLSNVSGLNLVPVDVFKSANGLLVANARYLRFVALTANNPGNNVGLNEIEVYSASAAGADRAFSLDGNLLDGTGTGISGENSGAVFSTNVPPILARGLSLQFNGESNQVRFADSANPAAYTIALWVNVETVQSSSILLRTDARGPTAWWSHQLRINGSGRFEHFTYAESGRSIAATNTITPGVWYHVALRASSNGNIQIFVNGAQSGGSTAIKSLWSGGTQWLLAGAAGNAPNYFRGLVDDVAVWHRELDDASIRALAAGRSPAQLGGYRRFFTTDLQETLYHRNSSAYLRIPFDLPAAGLYPALDLRTRSADGFVAFLNGREVARKNAPGTIDWNSAATADRLPSESIQFESMNLSPFAQYLLPGKNILAVQALNSTASDPAFLFAAELAARPALIGAVSNVAFSEISGAAGTNLFVEIRNFGTTPQLLAACTLQAGNGKFLALSNSIAAESSLVLSANDLNPLALKDGERIFLLGPGGELLDAAEMHKHSRGRTVDGPDAPWFYTAADTPGAPNAFSFHHEIVLNEIMYHHRPRYRTQEAPFAQNDEQWIELYNISNAAVDLTGWKLAGDISFSFPPGTLLPADGYLVIAKNAAALREDYPDITILGNFEDRLPRNSGQIILRDAAGNPANQVRYYNSHPWPDYANGGGSSLELRDPRSDNSRPEAWGASNETTKSNWRRYSYRTTAVRPVYSPSIYSFHEFRLGLLDEGEALIDNITVTELAAGAAPRQLLQNTNFTNGTQSWRLLGNHSHSVVEPRADVSSDPALHLIATGNTSYLDNRLETTLKAGSTLVPVVTGREYEIAFDAKWLAGSPQLHTELYYNKVAVTTILDQPAKAGTPGKRNSIYRNNEGPTYSRLAHFPVIPKSSDPIQVSISAADPDGVAVMRLFYSVNGGTWRDLPMNSTDSMIYSGTIPQQPNGAVIQFYIQGADAQGAVSTYPARGPLSGRSSRSTPRARSAESRLFGRS